MDEYLKKYLEQLEGTTTREQKAQILDKVYSDGYGDGANS